MTHVTWQCDCGLVEAKVPAKGNRIICYCESCRAFVVKLGRGDRLDAQGGSELLQTQPKDVTLVKGAEHLAYTRLTDKGPARWYTRCCNTPMANTLPTRALPFASFQVHNLQPKSALPEVAGMVHLNGATGHIEHVKKASIGGLVASLLAGAFTAYVTGKVKQNPFFDASGAPIGPRQDIA
ncbi:MAG: DUF6151 family protein [Pseudomonadota bacterium]